MDTKKNQQSESTKQLNGSRIGSWIPQLIFHFYAVVIKAIWRIVVAGFNIPEPGNSGVECLPNEFAPSVEDLQMIGGKSKCDREPDIIYSVVVGCETVGRIKDIA